MNAASLRSSLNLCALFATLLAGCASRPIDSGTDSDGGESTTTDTSGEMTTTATSGPGTTSGPETTTTTEPNTTAPECPPLDHHTIELTPEEYEHWQEHGTPPGGGALDSSTGDTSGQGTGSTTGGTTGDELSWELCAAICAHETGASEFEVAHCQMEGTDDLGNVTITCLVGPVCEGRRHACIASHGAEIGVDPVGAWFARAAHDEAASVHAFVALARELADHGAPAELLARIRDAADDEVRHARTAAALARRHGGEPQRPRRSELVTRSLLEIARENAVEGCVRETWAALSAAHQARCAEDPQIRAAMAVIADDEARHAELAWALDAWLKTVLSGSQWAEVEAARRAAADELVRHFAADERDPALIRRAGVPDRRTARALSAGLQDMLWSAGA